MSGCPKELQTDLSGHLLSLCPSVENRQMASRCFLVLVRGRTRDLDLAKDVAACQQHWRAANTSPYATNTGRHKNWYYTVQQSKGGCICHFDFGSQGKFTQDCVSSSKSPPGRALEEKFGNAMKSNVQAMQLDHPSSSVWWLQGYWHMLLNRYEFDKNQGIDWHVDDKDPKHETTYLSEHDPNQQLQCRGAVAFVHSKQERYNAGQEDRCHSARPRTPARWGRSVHGGRLPDILRTRRTDAARAIEHERRRYTL